MMMLSWIVFVVFVMKCSAMSRNELDEFSDYLYQTSQLDLNVKKGGNPDDDTFDEDEQISDNAWEESGKFEGDLILNDRQRRLIVENVEGLSRNGLTDSSKRWPDNELIYFIQREHFNSEQVQAIESGIEDLAQASCVKFRPYRKGDRDAVVIQGSRRGCFAQVGYQGGFQVLNLSGRHPAGRGCFRHGTVIHELLHTLGFYHMQSSPDRDDYINVIWENILQPTRHNFRKYNSFAVSDFGVGYDYDSVLHYSRRAFSANGKDTLVPKQSGVSIGQRRGLSDKDTLKLNKMYCDADSNNFEADEKQKPKKKKKPKNLPFSGHGIGYHQGKTVVIKLPTSENIKLPAVSTIDSFDYLSNGPHVMSLPNDAVKLYRDEVAYPYSPTLTTLTEYKMTGSLDDESPGQADEMASIEENNKEIAQWGDPTVSFTNSNPDESLAQAYERLTKTVKQKVYPESRDYAFKIDKDYSKFFNPSVYKVSDTLEGLNEGFGKSSKVSPNKPIRITQDRYQNEGDRRTIDSPEAHKVYEDTDSSYRTSLPLRKPYSAYEQTETPKYATLEYLKDRQNFSHLYTPRNGKQIRYIQHPAVTDNWHKKDSLRQKPLSYSDYTMEHKSNEALRRPNSYEDDDSRESPMNSQENISGDYTDEDSTESPNNNQAGFGEYDRGTNAGSPQKSQSYSLFGTPVPLSNSWYKPVYLNLENLPHSSGEGSESSEDS